MNSPTDDRFATGPADRPTELDSPGLFPPRGHYSHVTKHGGVAYISGQLPITPDGTALADQPFEAQVRQVLDNIDACLQAAGSDRDQLLSVTVFVTDIENWPQFDEIYADWLGTHQPTRIVTGVSSLHYGSALEVSAIAIAG